MFKKILVPTDGSETAQRAAQAAIDLALRYQAELALVSVVDPMPFVSFAGGEALSYYLEAAQEASTQGLAWVEDLAAKSGVSTTRQVLREHGPAQAICSFAQSAGCDLIVMGSHGRRGMDAVILGSVAQKVLTLAQVPVLIVK